MNSNFEKIPPDTKYKFLCYKKFEVNIFKYQVLKKHVGSCIKLPKSLQRQGLINITNKNNYCFHLVIHTLLKSSTKRSK